MTSIIPVEIVEKKILLMRGQKVMLDPVRNYDERLKFDKLFIKRTWFVSEL